MMYFSNLNWIDWMVIAFAIYYVYSYWSWGLFKILKEALTFIGGLWIAFEFYAPLGNFVIEKFGLPVGWSKLIAFIGLCTLSKIELDRLCDELYKRIPQKFHTSKYSKILSIIPSAANGLIFACFLLLLILGLPVRGTVKDDIRASQIGSVLSKQTDRFEEPARSIFTDAASEFAKFLTIESGSREHLTLNNTVETSELTIDSESEDQMLESINLERRKVGLKPLVIDNKIVVVARAHSQDMWTRNFFSHINPDGLDPFDRMRAKGVSFLAAGENIALAPDVITAHEGLMESPGHKRNIIDPNFGRVGIGVIDGGLSGKMFTQNFAD